MLNINEIKTTAQIYKERLTSEVVTPYSDLYWAADTILSLCEEIESHKSELKEKDIILKQCRFLMETIAMRFSNDKNYQIIGDKANEILEVMAKHKKEIEK